MTDSAAPAALSGCYAKIERANKHIKDLEPALKAFSDTNTYKIRPEYHTQTGRLHLVLSEVVDLSPDFSILIGEALYQLRSALDHLVWQLVLAKGNVPSRSNAFPIFIDIDKYKTAKGSMIQGVSTSAETVIDGLQPLVSGASYKSHPLWITSELNNIDKHRLLLVTRAVFRGAEIELTPPITVRKGGKYTQIGVPPVPLEKGAVLVWWETDQREVKVDGHLSIEVALKEVGDTKNEPVIPLLTQLSDYVMGVVKSFEPEFT